MSSVSTPPCEPSPPVSAPSLPLVLASSDWNGVDRLPMVIASEICSYLSLTGIINISYVNHYWQRVSQLPSSHHPTWGTYDLSHIDDDASIMEWLKRLVPFGIVSVKGSFQSVDLLTSTSSTLQSLHVSYLNPDLDITRFTRLTSLTIDQYTRVDHTKHVALLLLRHFQLNLSGQLYGQQVTDTDQPVDMIASILIHLPSPSLTSLELPGGSGMNGQQLRTLFSRLTALQRLDVTVADHESLAPLFSHSVSSLTSLVIRAPYRSWGESSLLSWSPVIPSSAASLQHIEFHESYVPSLDVLRAISIAAPNITRLDHIDARYDYNHSGGLNELATICQSFKHLQQLHLQLVVPQWLPFTALSHHRVMLELTIHCVDQYPVAIQSFASLPSLTRLHLIHDRRDLLRGDTSLVDAVITGSLAFVGLPRLMSLTLTNRIYDRFSWEYETETDGSESGDTPVWRPFIESFRDYRQQWQQLRISIDDPSLLMAWLALSPSFILPSQMIIITNNNLGWYGDGNDSAERCRTMLDSLRARGVLVTTSAPMTIPLGI